LTWDCTCIPLPGTDVIVAHNVALNADFAFSFGSLTINSGASLWETTPKRFSMASGAFTNNGDVSISTIVVSSGAFENNGNLRIDSAIALTTSLANSGIIYDVDSFWTTGTISNNDPAAKIIVDVIGWTTGTCVNDGTIEANNLWNDGTLINNGNVIVAVDMASTGVMSNAGRIEIGVDYWSTGNVLNSTTGIIEIGADCLQGDSLMSNSNWTNDGFVYVGNDFAVSDDMDGHVRLLRPHWRLRRF
jgi:hypothetical protein